MYKKYFYIILLLLTILSLIGYHLSWSNQEKSSPEKSYESSTGNIVEVRSLDGSSGSYLSSTTEKIETQEYGFSNGKYRISFLAPKATLVESRHAGDIIRNIQEMRDFLSTTSYQQSTERMYDSNDCNYATYTGTYLGDPYSESYSKEDIEKLTDKQVRDAYNGRGIRARVQDMDYAPYPNFSILENYGQMDTCHPIPSIVYSRNDGNSINFYIYNKEEAQKKIGEWKVWAEGWSIIGRTKDGYPLYEYAAAIGSKYYYIELDDGDILSLGGSFPDIRIHRIGY